jgi:hypothetical protein
MRCKHFVWPGARDSIRSLAAHWALALVLRAVSASAAETAPVVGSP